ncbi:TetR/AcrR family transcriptional regulator [Ferrovibrio sp.]|uniref:TetR/AcrR family transcriptional regulator n=1 Tax=Ferrovibrio sp. TaxID=1917215 RepID=UPI00260D4130|nr:TetR/AcrR family transcriptional regulator [Ferrovibrio sp.]
MSSQKASALSKPPQRRRGRERVAALLAAGAQVIAEKGYDGATMTEIAARAGASIGSLYQFFPTKAAVADALLEQYMAAVHAHLDGIEAQAATAPLADLAQALCHALVTMRAANPALVVLIENGTIDPAMIATIRRAMRQRVVAILRRRARRMPAAELAAMAAAVLQMMKSAAAMHADATLPGRKAALEELCRMLCGYLQARLD